MLRSDLSQKPTNSFRSQGLAVIEQRVFLFFVQLRLRLCFRRCPDREVESTSASVLTSASSNVKWMDKAWIKHMLYLVELCVPGA